MKQIVISALEHEWVFESAGEDVGKGRYWCRIRCNRLIDIVEFPDTWVEDREAYRIRTTMRDCIRRLQRQPRA